MTSNLSVKLLVDKKSQKVIFAEAGKEFVDFLFSLLALPVGTVVKLLTRDRMVGAIGNLYNSVESLSEAYLEQNKSTASLLETQLLPPLLSNPTEPKPEVTYCCAWCATYNRVVTKKINNGRIVCPQCQQETRIRTDMDKLGGNIKGSFVKGVVTYMIMDDLSVTPMSTISGITILNKFNITEIGLLEEKVVKLGIDEGLALLKASLQSKTVFTDIFLGKKIH